MEVNGKACLAEGEAKSGLRNSSTLKTHENCEESFSSTRRIRNSKKPLRMLEKSWKHQWLLLCPVKLRKIVGVVHPTKLKTKLACILEADEQWLQPCLARQARRVSMGRPVVRPMSSNQNLRVFWKLMNPQDCVWKNVYQIIMRTILQEEVTIHYNITIWYTIYSYEQQWIKNGINLKRFRRGT